MSDLSPTERALQAVLRGAGRLPVPLQAKLAGRRAIIDGQQVHPEVGMALRGLSAIPGSSFEDLPLDKARAQISSEAKLFGDSRTVARVDDMIIPTVGGVSVPARVYRDSGSDTPALVYFHGGGWVVGGLDSCDSVCRHLAAETGVTVVSVDYRLAPEHPYPAAVEDCEAAYRWVVAHAGDLGIDPDRVGVGGDSAGGNLAAVISRRLRDASRAGDSSAAPAFQLLFFPVTDLSTKHASYRKFATGYFLTEKQMDWYSGHYLPDRAQSTSPDVSPLLATDLTDLPPAYVGVAGFDPLRDEGIAYAERLRDAGNAVDLFVERNHIHAYVNSTGVGRTGRIALDHACRWLRATVEKAAG